MSLSPRDECRRHLHRHNSKLSSLHPTHSQLQSTPEGVHAGAIHHVRGRHAWAWGRGPSRGHAMLLPPSQHASPAIEWDKSILLRKALRTGIESLETSLWMLVLPAILQLIVRQSRQRHSTSVQCRYPMYGLCAKSIAQRQVARCLSSIGIGYSLRVAAQRRTCCMPGW